MDPETYWSKLSESEKEVEFTIRGLSSKATDSREILFNSLNAESQDKLLKPAHCHIKINPETEAQFCIARYEDLSKATQEQGVNPKTDFIIIALAKTIHYKDRIERLINSFGDVQNISSMQSNIRRIFNWLMKLWLETKTPDGAAALTIPAIIPNAATSSPHNTQFNIQPGQQRMEGIFDARSRTIMEEGNQLRSSVADFFKKIDNTRVNIGSNNNNIPQVSQLSFGNIDQETQRENMFNRDNRNESTARLGNHSRQPATQFQMNNFYKIKQRWNLSFDGTDNSNVHDFTYRLEQMARDDGFPVTALPKILHVFVFKKAEDWYWIYKLDHPDATWTEMKVAMTSYFSSYDFEEEIREQIFRRHQGNKETFSDFALSIQKLNARLQNRLTEKDLIYRLCQNMQPALRNVTLPTQHFIKNIEDLRVLCQRYERMWDQTGYDPRRFTDIPYRRRQINEISEQLQTTYLETPVNMNASNNFENRYPTSQNDQHFSQYQSVEAFQRPVNQVAKQREPMGVIICWNCKDLGHRYQECDRQFLNVFCFGCGADNVRKPNCAHCAQFTSGNHHPGVNVSRVAHSGRMTCPVPTPREILKPGQIDK